MDDLEKQYPGVELAYPIAREAFDVMMKRLDNVEARANTILALAVAFGLPIPTLAAGRGLQFSSGWFLAAVIVFAAGLAIGIYGRLAGTVQVLSPDIFFEKWLHYSDWEFKKNFIYFAGQICDANRQLAFKRHRYTVISSLLFLAAAVLAAVWGVLGRPS